MNGERHAQMNALWGQLIVEELIRQGADQFCVAPGSRSAPLAAAARRHSRARVTVHPDERGLGFYALGLAVATGRPAVVIVTSGSAVANLFPAVVEASKKKVPMIILSADRPPELRHTGANQTIDQVRIFGGYTRFDFDLPCPTEDIPPAMVLTTMDQAVYRSRHPLPGPVQINCMFREPLWPESPSPREDDTSLEAWRTGGQAYTAYHAPQKTVSPAALDAADRVFSRARNGLILVGKIPADAGPEVLRLAEVLGWPVLPDITSGLRLGGTGAGVIPHFDQLLGISAFHDRLLKTYAPDVVLQLGGRMTSRRVMDFVARAVPAEYVMVLNHPLRHDPSHRVTLRVEAPVADFCRSAAARVTPRPPTELTQVLTRASRTAAEALEAVLDQEGALSEPFCHRTVSRLIPADSGLFMASSMPVRDMDAFAAADGPAVTVSSNRGASGIDGTLASAAGFAAGLQRPVTLMVGDLAFGHDLNSLPLLKRADQPLPVILLNNNGGGIFSFLPAARQTDIFEDIFAAPQDLDFAALVRGFGIAHTAPTTRQAFIAAYQTALTQTGPTVIEVRTRRDENVRLHQDLTSAVSLCLEKEL